jgi:exopolysaccharide biosynthesis polyprenyl glycosylphosphotransferase
LRGRRFWRDALRRRFLVAADVAAVATAAATVEVWGGGVDAARAVALYLPGWIVVAKVCGLYDRDHRALRHLTLDELPQIVVWALAGAAGLTMLQIPLPGDGLSSPERVRVWAVLVVAAVVLRSLARFAWRGIVPPERVVVLGGGALAAAARRKIELFSDMHVDVVRELEPPLDAEGALERVLDDVERVIVATPSLDERLLTDLLRVTRAKRVKLSVVPPIRTALGTAVQLSHVADLPLVEYHTWDASRTTLLAKRCLDICVAALALAVLSPLLVVVAVAVRLTSPGPAFFIQTRAGVRGKPFRMFKFRTMVADAHARRADVVDLDRLDGPSYKLRRDPRVTALGRILRQTSLDELPQLLNVLRGDMSLVGPRPEEVEVVQRYQPEHTFRLTVKPGLTGPMQVYGRGALSFEERLSVERDYVENVSLGRDLRILGMTIGSVFRRSGAF